MAEIQVAVQDGERKAFPQRTTVAEALKGLVSGKQRKQTVAVRCDGRMLDLSTLLAEDAVLEPVSVYSEAGVEILRHSTAHRITSYNVCYTKLLRTTSWSAAR